MVIFTDHRGRKIRLTDERHTHVFQHSEMVGQLQCLEETLLEPELIVATTVDPSVHVYHRFYLVTPVTRKYLLVAVKMLPDDAFVLTAFFSSRTKKGRIVWQR
jgi:hypothetical protein